MLQRLSITNVALIEKLDLEFSEGLNILTGETGAGKSIVIDSVNLVLGERASRELIKHGEQKAKVEAEFSQICEAKIQKVLEENGIDAEDDGTLILSREITAAGKSMCRINGTLITLNVLKAVSDHLIDVHGQHEHQSLLNPLTHVDFLDLCAPPEKMNSAKDKTAKAASLYHKLIAQSKGSLMSEEERERETDLLEYQIREIEAAKLESGEEETLTRERTRLSNAEKIMSALEASYAGINEERGALEALQHAKHSMEEIAEFSEEYKALSSRLADAYYGIEDIGYTLRDCKNNFEFDAERLGEIENRLDAIMTLKRKYGGSIEEILAFCEKAKEKLQSIINAAADREALQRKIGEVETAYLEAARELSELRRQSAKKLDAQMIKELREVGMSKADFSTVFSKAEKTLFTANGEDQVEFLLSANPGEPLKPLSKVASGGELSRIMLAFKTILADRDAMPTLIFDEIDTGISGKMASVVGEKMVKISALHQILCVTHLPQIAAMADAHYMVEKTDDGKSTHTNVIQLDEEGSVKRLSAMMSGEADSKLGQEHARELLASSKKQKAALRQN